MTLDDFCGKLIDKYRDGSETDIFDLKNWCRVEGLGETYLDMLYNKIIKEHDSSFFPTLPTIIRIWDSTPRSTTDDQRSERYCLEYTRDFPVEKIVRLYKNFMFLEEKNYVHINFMAVWSDLYYCHEYLYAQKDEGKIDWADSRIIAYCKRIKEKIIEGENIIYGSIGTLPEREREAEIKKFDQLEVFK